MAERDPRWPHVTDILREAGLVDARWMQQYHLDRGNAVHLATLLDDEDDLDESTVAPDVDPYLRAYRQFRAENHLEIFAREEFVTHLTMGYCGTLDIRGLFEWRRHISEAILDLKCGAASCWHPVQLAAYAGTFPRPLARYNVYLRDDGRYEVVSHRGREDWPVFKAALLLGKWRKGRA